MRYHDFLLYLDASPAGGYKATLVDSPAGEADGTFELPVSPEEVQQLAETLERAARASRAGRGAALPDAPLAPAATDLGDRLFRALFPPPIRSRYDECLGKLGPDEGLRITLQIGLEDPAREPLHALPWECLYQASAGAFLARSRRTPVVRHLALPLPGTRSAVPPPLRVLAVASEPSDLPALGLAAEVAALERLGHGVEAEPLPRADLSLLRDALLAGGVHVLHFLGHGGHAPDGRGVLYFTGDDGRSAEVGAAELAAHLRDATSLRLVVLNACQTAQAGAAGALATVAGALLQAGVPAVVAMQFPVGDQAAIAFSKTFYRRLAAGDPVEAAVTEGRLAIAGKLRGSLEWITPVLFLRAADGRLVLPVRRRPRRAWGAWGALGLAGAALLAAAGAYLLRDRAPSASSAASEPGTLRGPGPRTELPAPEPASPGSTEAPQPTEPEPEDAAPAGTEQLEPPPVVRPPAPAPPAPPRSYSLAAGTPLYLPEVRAHVTADFMILDGEEYVRLTLAPDDGDQVLRAVYGPTELFFETSAGRRSVRVLAVDPAGRTVTVRPGAP